MSAPRNYRLRKTTYHVAVRQAAVQGAHRAFPHLTSEELAAALGLTRHSVRHYLLGDIKSAHAAPAWTGDFFEACAQLASNPSAAALAFETLARRLYAEQRPSQSTAAA